MCERSSETRSTRLLMLSQSAAFQELSSFFLKKKNNTHIYRHNFRAADFRISPSEETVKRLNLDIDLQMLPTALHACCHSSHRGETLSGREKSVQLLRQVSTLRKCWQAGESGSGINLYVEAGERIHK